MGAAVNKFAHLFRTAGDPHEFWAGYGAIWVISVHPVLEDIEVPINFFRSALG